MSDNPAEGNGTAGVVVRPPILFAAGLGAGIVAKLVWPLAAGFAARPWALALGFVLIVAGFVLLALCLRRFRSAGTNVETWKPTTSLVSSGPYRFSRNPIYIGLSGLYLGLALVANLLWSLILLPVIWIVLHFGVVRREERYLEQRFGDDYRSYRSRVRRYV